MFPDALYCYHCFRHKIMGEEMDKTVHWWKCENCGDPDYRNQSGRISFLCSKCCASLEVISTRYQKKQIMHFHEYDIRANNTWAKCPCGKESDCIVDYLTYGVTGQIKEWSIFMCHDCFIRAACKVIQDGKGKTAFEPVPTIIPSAKFGFSYN